jgi:hypothetical protein
MGKRQREGDDDEPQRLPRGEASIGQQTSGIKNKQRRNELYGKLKHKAKVDKKKARVKRQAEVAKALELGLVPPPRPVPKARVGRCRALLPCSRAEHAADD